MENIISAHSFLCNFICHTLSEGYSLMWFRTKKLRRIFGLREMKCRVPFSNLVKKDETGWAYNVQQIIEECIHILV